MTSTTPGTAETTFTGRTAVITYTPGSTYNIVMPGQDAYIRVLKVPRGSTPPAGAISADDCRYDAWNPRWLAFSVTYNGGFTYFITVCTPGGDPPGDFCDCKPAWAPP